MGVREERHFAIPRRFSALREGLPQKHESGPSHIEIGKAHHTQLLDRAVVPGGVRRRGQRLADTDVGRREV